MSCQHWLIYRGLDAAHRAYSERKGPLKHNTGASGQKYLGWGKWKQFYVNIGVSKLDAPYLMFSVKKPYKDLIDGHVYPHQFLVFNEASRSEFVCGSCKQYRVTHEELSKILQDVAEQVRRLPKEAEKMEKEVEKKEQKGDPRILSEKTIRRMRNHSVLVDLDGTLWATTPNWSMERNSEWEAETMNAQIYWDAVEQIKAFKEQGYKIVILTARGQSCKDYTRRKLRETGIHQMVDAIWHRPKKWEGKPSALYKKAMIEKLIREGYKFVWAMEDEKGNKDVMEGFGMQIWHGRG